MAQFLQSPHDFPLMVRLGPDIPSWELNRWGLDSLRFSPPIEDKFSLRGDHRRFQYSGKRESHRFTILDNERFEYDIILKKEPETNKVYIIIDGWEQYDFLRQPDAFGPEILRGSYAVYRKEQIIGTQKYRTGTGKLCHIHRPEIIDAAGRKIWGILHIEKGIMTISIPEHWLSEAKYPVVIDPILGTATVGAYITYPFISQYWVNYYKTREGESYRVENHSNNYRFEIVDSVALNKFTLGQNLQGQYKAYFYAHNNEYDASHDFQSWPVVFNNTAANKPSILLSNQEEECNLRVSNINPEGWKMAKVNIPNQIVSGTPVWFGLFSYYSFLRFDYGLQCIEYYLEYCEDWDTGTYEEDGEIYEYENEVEVPVHEWIRREENVPLDQKAYMNPHYKEGDNSSWNVYPGARVDFRLSMYLEEYSIAYTRTLTQGVNLADMRIRRQEIKKTIPQSMKITESSGRVHGAVRIPRESITLPDAAAKSHGIIKTFTQSIGVSQIISRAHDVVRRNEQTTVAAEQVTRARGMFRFIESGITAFDLNKPIRVLVRLISQMAENFTEVRNWRDIRRSAADGIKPLDNVNRGQGFFTTLLTVLGLGDKAGYSNEWGRHIADSTGAKAETEHAGQYLRELRETPEIEAETGHAADYQRFQHDTGKPIGDVKRMLTVFVKLFSGSSIRDYIIGRFLKSKEELQIKSKITRPLFIDSKIH
jgi:hypothetical protein